MEDLVQAFAEIDDGLRVIVTMKRTSWEIEYIRDDVDDTYAASDFERTYRSHMANQVSSDDLSQVIEGGGFVGQLYMFEDLVVFQFPASRYEGFFVSYDWRDSFPIQAVFDAAKQLPSIE
jgi:hypothetical protein